MRLRIRTPSRLHFGLLSFGQPERRQFGGVGAMIELPGIELWAQRSKAFTVSGLYPDRVQRAAQHWCDFYKTELPKTHLSIASAPRQHVGLGVGTQLSLAVAAALHGGIGQSLPGPVELARSVQRATRSAIGVYGFLEGGLIVERGKLPDESLSPLDCRLELPSEWRFLLATPLRHEGLSGAAEAETFGRLPPVPLETTHQLIDELQLSLVPAAAQGDLRAFSASLHRYGRQAGMCFAAVQGGPYFGPAVTRLVEQLRAMGVEGVGQTSWGPTVFALLPTQSDAEKIAGQLAADIAEPLDLTITPPANHGAQCQWIRGDEARSEEKT
jgi:beta-RFAP synthase